MILTDLAQVLLALVAVMVVGRLLGWLVRYIGQPHVIGEMLAGILLGPSLLGQEWSSAILPPRIAPFLGIIAQVGVILYMFLVGIELNADLLQARVKTVFFISHASIVLPMVLGIGLAFILYPALGDEKVPVFSFALFLGVALSITAFPVLARILGDRKMDQTELGRLALGSAAMADVTAWCLLALVLGIVQAQVGVALLIIGLATAFIAFVVVGVRPVLVAWTRRCEAAPLGPQSLTAMLILVLAASLATEAIGIHALFGSFLIGAMIPHNSRLAREVIGKLHDLTTILFLPAFFALTGMNTRIGLVEGWEQWLLGGLIILVASVGKIGGAGLAAWLAGLGGRTSLGLGILMNTRGLMELIVLHIGLSLGLIAPPLFALMVLMALATTMATAPLISLLNPKPLDPRASDLKNLRDLAEPGEVQRPE